MADTQEQRCQSCGMPMEKGFFGSNADDSENTTFCRFCFQKGVFTEPELSMQAMIEASISHMTRVLQIPEAQAKQRASEMIPKLARWSPIV